MSSGDGGGVNEEEFHEDDWVAVGVLEKLSDQKISFNQRVVELGA